MAEPKTKTVNTERASKTGTVINSGIIRSGDKNMRLTGRQKFQEYERMIDTNGAVQEIINLATQPIRSASWFFGVKGEDAAAIERKEFTENVYFENLNMPFDAFMEHILDMIPYGFSLFERVYIEVDWNGKTYLIPQYFPILQQSVYKWVTEDGSPGITQMTGDGFTASIPMENLLLFTFRQKGDNYEGKPLLRAMSPSFNYVDKFYRFEAIGHERSHVNIPHLEYPLGATPEDIAEAEEVVANMRVNEVQYISTPPGYKITMIGGSSQTTDIGSSIDRHNLQMAHAGMVAFAYAGSTPNGNYSSSVNLASMFEHMLESVGMQIAGILDKEIKAAIDLNFVQTVEYPKADWSGISRDDVANISTAVQRFAQAGLLTADESTENHVRKLVNFPEKEVIATPDNVMTVDPQAPTQASEKAVAVEIMPNETRDDCIKRAIPMLLAEGMDAERAVSAAYSMCEIAPVDSKQQEMTGKTEEQIKIESSKWGRPLTAAEDKVQFESLQKRIDRAENAINSKLKTLSQQQRDNLIEQVRTALQSPNPTAALQGIEVAFQNQYGSILFDELKTLFEYAKLTTADEMKQSAPATAPEQINNLQAKTDISKNDYTEGMKQAAIAAAVSGIVAGLSSQEIIDQVSQRIDKVGESKIQKTAEANVIGAITQGRSFTQTMYENTIYAYQYSAIMDDRTCNTCAAADGKVIRVNDPDYNRLAPPQHYGCRCIWVEILKEEKDKPEITGIPEGLDRKTDINNFEQISKSELKQIQDQ